METIKGKPELVRNPRPPRPRLSHSRAARRAGTGSEGNGLPSGQVVPASPLPPRPTAAGRGATRCSQTGLAASVGERARLSPAAGARGRAVTHMCLEDALTPWQHAHGHRLDRSGPRLPLHVCVCVRTGREGHTRASGVSGQSGAWRREGAQRLECHVVGGARLVPGELTGVSRHLRPCAQSPVMLRVWKPGSTGVASGQCSQSPNHSASVTQSPVSGLQSVVA